MTYLNGIFIVRCSEDLLDYQLSCPCHDDRFVAEISVLEQDPGIFLVNADCDIQP